MSFVWKAPQRLKSPEQAARELLEVAREMGLDEFAAVLAVMCVAQESDFWCPANEKDPSSKNYPHDALSNDGRSVAYFQQQNGRAGDTLPAGDRDNWWGSMASRMGLRSSARVFYERLEDNYREAINDPGTASRRFIQNVQKSAYPDAYAKHWARAWSLVRAAQSNAPTQEATVPENRPDFNEINQIGYDAANPHGSVRSRPPINFFLHTQEGDGDATSLAAYLRSTRGGAAVSYHYTIREDANDHGVTVVDVIDTDLYSWSVLNANVFSINLCFAGSRAAWTRDQWLQQGRAIDVAAYLAVQDCKKYKMLTEVLVPPYAGAARGGISDHKYVTQKLGIGNHTDVGANFPWDVFAAAVKKYVDAGLPVTVPPPTTPPVAKPPQPVGPADDQLTLRWNALGGQTIVEALAEVRDKVMGTSDRAKVGAK